MYEFRCVIRELYCNLHILLCPNFRKGLNDVAICNDTRLLWVKERTIVRTFFTWQATIWHNKEVNNIWSLHQVKFLHLVRPALFWSHQELAIIKFDYRMKCTIYSTRSSPSLTLVSITSIYLLPARWHCGKAVRCIQVLCIFWPRQIVSNATS